jgi:diguanylate cyclase (GGDEF)-like protein
MKDNTKVIITLGFSAILCLMFALVFIALSQLQALNRSMSKLVEDTNAKMEAAHTMRDAIRLRANALKSMQLSQDSFEKDAELMRFYGYSGMYRRAREELVSKQMDERERDIHARLSEMTRIAQPVNEHAVDLLMSGAPPELIGNAVEEARQTRDGLLRLLDELVVLEKDNAAQALNAANEHYGQTRQAMIFLVGIAMVCCVLIAALVIRRASDKNRRISYQASHDELTGLLNRRAFEYELKMLVDDVEAGGGRHALLYLDLDQFKIVNDTCGHMAGDELLCQLTALFEDRLRTTDTVARLGGDEFGILLRHCPLRVAMRVGEMLRQSVEEFRFSWEEKSFSLGASIGVVPVVSDSGDLTKILSTADMACLVAKQAGRNRVHAVQNNDHQIVRHRGEMEWVGRIKDALEHDRFQLFSQTIVPIDAVSGEPGHLEVLIRMLDADGNLVLPGAFIPAAERYGLMSAIDTWVFEHAVRWLRMQSMYMPLPRLMINLSGQSLCDQHFLPFVLETLKTSRVSTQSICFEITETAAIANLAKAKEFISTLKRRGCRFALDDFGSGLSSFSYLKELPVDYLKIDGAFVKDMVDDPIDYAMVKSINEIGHVMGKKTIAEFVETDAVFQKLRELGVDFAQGFGIARPQPLEQPSGAEAAVPKASAILTPALKAGEHSI